jgi:hypothetical protein
MARWDFVCPRVGAVFFVLAASACASAPASNDGSLAFAEGIRGGCVKTNFNCPLPAQACDGDPTLSLASLARTGLACNGAGEQSWSIAEGTIARDGRGKILGVVAESAIAIVFGQKKTMNNLDRGGFVLGAQMKLTSGEIVTAWVAEAAIHDDTAILPSLVLDDPGNGNGPRFWITGGDPSKFASLAIAQDGTSSTPASAYLASAAGTICLLYNTPGYGSGGVPADVLAVNSGAEFTRAPGVPTVDVYTLDAAGKKGPTMKFVYGHVVGKPNADRFGWIAFDALEAE